MTQVGRQIVLASRPQGRPEPNNFRLEEFRLPELHDGEVLVAVEFLSLDPYMRARMDDRKSYAPPVALGEVMPGEAVARVIASRSAGYREGDRVLCYSGWRTHAVLAARLLRHIDPRCTPISTALGVLGMPGFTAYAGLRNIGRVRAGETLVVAAASGPVGSMVGQLARMQGARVVGIAGGPHKCRYIKEELGFDVALDHREPGLAEMLAVACPDGIDVYFELVGGRIWGAVFPLLNTHARVPVCGLIAQYDHAVSVMPVPQVQTPGVDADHPAGLGVAQMMRGILDRSLTLRGFIQHEFADQRSDFLDEVAPWVHEGRVRYREHIVDGLDRAPEAFMGMLAGANFGKMLVRMDVQRH